MTALDALRAWQRDLAAWERARPGSRERLDAGQRLRLTERAWQAARAAMDDDARAAVLALAGGV